MQKIVISSDWQLKLRSVAQIAELCDERGQLIGYFAPSAPQTSYRGVDGTASEAELLRREREGGRSLEEIMADLDNCS